MDKEYYIKAKEDRTVLVGRVICAIKLSTKSKNKDAVLVKPRGDSKPRVAIPYVNLGIHIKPDTIKRLIDEGATIDFRIRKVNNPGGIYGERDSILEDIKNDIINSNGEKVFTAKIGTIVDHGAYLKIKGVYVFMYNSGFAEGYIPISAVKKYGDKVEVVFDKVNAQTGTIYVKMKEKYKEEMTLQYEDIKEQDTMRGIIRTKTSNLCFVNIAPMIDVLCYPIEGLEVGDEVNVKIIGLKTRADGKPMVRGKIMLSKFSDEFRL